MLAKPLLACGPTCKDLGPDSPHALSALTSLATPCHPLCQLQILMVMAFPVMMSEAILAYRAPLFGACGCKGECGKASGCACGVSGQCACQG